jgi:hypothetical protein
MPKRLVASLAVLVCLLAAGGGGAQTSGSPVAVTLQQVDGGPSYYARFTNPLPSDPSFFPIGVWYASVLSAADAATDQAAGLNTYVELTPDTDLSAVRAAGMHAIHSGQAAGAGSETNGWLVTDEPDGWAGPGWAAWTGNLPNQGPICDPPTASCGYTVLSTLAARLPADGRMRYTNFDYGVTFVESDAEASLFLNGGFQDLVSADNYWFTDNDICTAEHGGAMLGDGHALDAHQCRRAANYGATVARMRKLAGEARPVWAFVELGHPYAEMSWPTITPPQVEAAVWHSLIAGARGIIYFNHSFGGPNVTGNVLRHPAYASIRAAVTATNARITALAPVLNAPTVTSGWSQESGVKTMVKWSGGHFYVFAGSAGSAVTSSFSMPCVGDATATVLDENRALPVAGGSFTDSFADGNAVHVYRLDGGATCGLA